MSQYDDLKIRVDHYDNIYYGSVILPYIMKAI